MNGRHNHRTLGQAPHSAAVYLTLNAEHSSVIYRWPTSGDHCHILLGVHNDHIDDGDKDDEDEGDDNDDNDDDSNNNDDSDDDDDEEVNHWCLSLSDDSAQVTPTGVDSHSCQ